MTHSDLNSVPQKLSKIETLRLARNYIIAMTQTLQEGQPMEITRFIKLLSKELSQTTANLLTGTVLSNLHMNNRKLYMNNEHENYVYDYNQDNSYYNNSSNNNNYLDDNYNNKFWTNYSNYKLNCEMVYKQSGTNIHNFRYWDSNNYLLNEHCLYGNYQY